MLLLLRLYVGAFYFQTGANKFAKGDWGLEYADNLIATVREATQLAADPAASHGPFQFYAWFLESVVLPNPYLFTLLVTWGELAVGVSLFFGLASRLGAGVAIFLSLNFALMSGRAIWLPGLDAILIFACLTLLWTASGRHFGFDYFFNNRWPKAGIW